MTFAISFTHEQVPDGFIEPGEKACFAEIIIDDFRERLLVPLDYWQKQDYIGQWINQVDSFLNKQTDKAVLIVEMQDPVHANFIKCWTLYREGGAVSIANNIIFTDQIKRQFSAGDIQDYVAPIREKLTEEGDEISAWNTTEDAIRQWFVKLKHAYSGEQR